LIYDGTMNNVRSYKPLIELLKSRNYKIFIVYMDKVPKDVIMQRMKERYLKTGRFVPAEVVDDFFKKGTSAFEELKPLVDGYLVIDGSNQDYNIIEKGGMQLPEDRAYSKLGQKISAEELEKIEYKRGGNLDKKDSVELDIPLLIRVLEFAREDIKSDPELHHVVERLIEIRDKGVLTMEDYDFIADLKKKEKFSEIERKYANGGSVLLAPNGQPSNLTTEQYKLVRTPAFKKWFGDWENDPKNASKVVDSNGEPLVVYHGTNVPNITIFKESFDGGYWFTSNFEVAKDFAINNNIGGKTNIYNCFLSIKNPYITDLSGDFLEHSKDLVDSIKYAYENADGMIIYNAFDQIESNLISNIYNCFDPNQIKLADGTNTTFDPNNDDIRFETGGNVLLAPNGKPSNLTPEQYKLVRTPAFKKWFGDWENAPENASKVVDSNGEPLVVYHGTNTEFTSFSKERINSATGFGDFGAGFYFTASHNTAKYYTLKSENGRFIMSVFLNIRNPFIIDLNWEKLSKESIDRYKKLKSLDYEKEIINNSLLDEYRPSKRISKEIGDWRFQEILSTNGFDGVFVNRINIHEKSSINLEDEILYLHEIIAFKNTQIKLADGINTTFDPNNDDIRYESGGKIENQVNELKNLPYNSLLRHIQDSYKELGAEVGVKGHTTDGEPIIGYLPYQYEYMYTSALTNKKIRFFIELEDGTLIHPSEINPKFSVSEQKRLEQTADQFYRNGIENYENAIENLKKNQELDLVKESLEKALNNGFEIENQYDGNDYFKNNGSSILVNPKNGIRLTISKYIERIKDEIPQTNLSNLDLLKFKDEYLPKFSKGGTVLLAPNGQPSNLTLKQYKLVRTPEFKAWFGDWETDPKNASKVVDENGEPLVVYHYTNAKNIEEFYPFAQDLLNGNKSKNEVEDIITKWRNSKSIGLSDFSAGTFFTPKRGAYSSYGENEYACFLKGDFILNTGEFLKGEKYIGIPSMDAPIWYYWNDNIPEIIALYPNQIKLADGTNTTFDPNNDDIRFETGGTVLLAPNGQPSNLTPEQYKLVRTPAFKKWFGDWENAPENASKVVDENGEPLVVYHGTSNGKFYEFSKKKLGQNFDVSTLGFYFTNGLEPNIKKGIFYGSTAGEYSRLNPNGTPSIFEVFLNVKNPININADDWYSPNNAIDKQRSELTREKEYGYDGIISKALNTEEFGKEIIVVAFEPNQIKLADGTNTTFDPNNEDIRFENGGEIKFTSTKSATIKTGSDLYKIEYRRNELGDTDKNVWFADVVSKNGKEVDGRLCFEPEYYAVIYGFSLKEVENLVFECFKENKLWIVLVDDSDNEKEVIHVDGKYDPNSDNSFYKQGGNLKNEKYLTLYHGTILKNLPKIEKNGLVSNLGYSASWYMLSTDFESALYHANTINEGDKVPVIEFHIPITETNRWDGYPFVWTEEKRNDKSSWYAPMQEIPKEFIHKIHYVSYNNWLKQKAESFKKGGTTIAQTPAPSKKRIYGSQKNKPKSSKDSSSAESIKFDEKTRTSIENKLKEHNDQHPDVKVNLATAKAVVRRGMGAYSSSHRPTISGGKPNSRVAWGLARLNAFLYKAVNGESKSGKYSQDNDLLDELSIAHDKFKTGGEIERKQKQLEIINSTNSAPNEYNTWIRTAEDIKTAEEVFSIAFEDGAMYPDFQTDDMSEALKSGYVTIYSSYPIKEGVFVTPSKMNALDYAGGKVGKVFSKKVHLKDVAWIDESEGQYAPTESFKTGGKVPEKNKNGNCYEAAGRIVIYATRPDKTKIEYIGTPYLVHAQVTGQGAIEGMKYGHAWIEDDVFVYDYSNNRKLEIPKALYYKAGKIIEQQPIYFKYTFAEAKSKMKDTEHYGSWDLITESGL
jgi:hypothetical protein